jgi:GntR family transcriptional regulator / MocR family aminotransferase
MHQISDGSNYFFQPNTYRSKDFIRIGYCSLDETEMAGAIHLWRKALASAVPNAKNYQIN